jgi:hypothetical protein
MFTGPNIITDGLVTYFDVANIESFRGEPTTNLFQNPLLINETGLASGWANYGSSYEVVSETYNNDVGFSQRFYAPPSGTTFRNTGIRLNLIATISQIYTLSFYGKNIETETSISYFAQGWSSLQSNIISLSEGWKFYTLRLTATSTSPILYIRPNGNNVNFGFDSLIYKPQIEQKSYATPFVDGTRGTTVATGGGVADISNNSTNATIFGTTYNSNNLGSLFFDGTDDYLTITQPNITTSPNSWTILLWMNPGNQSSRFITPQSNGIDQYLGYDPVNQRAQITVATSADTNERVRSMSSSTVPLNEWTFLTISLDDLTIKMYSNGILRNTFAETLSIANWSSTWVIGQRGNATFWYLGSISNLKIYNRALTADEILQNFNSTKSRFGLS